MSSMQLSAGSGLARNLAVGFAGLAFLTVAPTGLAQTPDPAWVPNKYVAFGGLYLVPGDERNADYGTGFNLAYGDRFGTRQFWELKLFTSILETGPVAIDAYQTGAGLDVQQTVGPEGASHFFVFGGGGVTLNDVQPNTDDGTSYYVNAGVGYRGKVWEDWGLRPRVELRTVYDTIGDGTNDIGLAFLLEIPPKREKYVEKRVEVERRIEVPVEVEKIVEKEVPCVVPVAPVTAAAPMDGDADGVPDATDRCLNTLAGAKVDAEGCVVAQEQTINLPNVEFEPGSAALTAAGKEKLEPVVAFLSSQAAVQMDIIGHTDWQGSAASNQVLSEDRARAVLDYLAGRAIAPERLSSSGRGETQPMASNKTAQGRAQNRRVELRFRTQG